VINQNEQVQKTSEISIENSKRVILSDNNSSSTSTTFEKSRVTTHESNGMLQNCEKFCDKECTMESESKTSPTVAADENCNFSNNNNINSNNNNVNANGVASNSNLPKTSASCNDLLILGKQQQQQPPQHPKDFVPTSAADFSIPYNIINNYFSGNL
jgi:hypothetical protein